MPEFALDYGSPLVAREYAKLDGFTQGYIEAMFFTSTGTGDDYELEFVTLDDLAPDAWAKIVSECAEWQQINAALLQEAYGLDYSEEQAGRDYWFTRNGHGTGFWDRRELSNDDLGDRLSAVSRDSDRRLYMGDDGQVYYE